MKIAIKEKTLQKLQSLLNGVNGDARDHTFNARDILWLTQQIEDELAALGIPKKDRNGAAVYASSGDAVPNSYKYKRIGTGVRLLRGSTHWFLVSAKRETIWQEGGGYRLVLTQEQDAKAVAVLRSGYAVAPAVMTQEAG